PPVRPPWRHAPPAVRGHASRRLCLGRSRPSTRPPARMRPRGPAASAWRNPGRPRGPLFWRPLQLPRPPSPLSLFISPSLSPQSLSLSSFFLLFIPLSLSLLSLSSFSLFFIY